jgi:hypothetical protein
MAEEPGKIKEYIEAERKKLGDDLEEIEHRMKDAVDLRVWYNKHTTVVLGAAVAGGFLLSTFVGGSTSSESNGKPAGPVTGDSNWKGDWRGESSVRPHTPKKSRTMYRVGDILDSTVAALLGVAAHKFQEFVSQTIPDFKEQYSEAERKRFG